MSHQTLSRRNLLAGSLAAAVAAFCPARRAWATAPGSGTIVIPSLDGQLLTDAATLAQAADDFGHIAHTTPTAVLVPGSVHDIEKLVQFARKHGIQVAAAHGIGQSHSTQGQSQTAGVVIDMSALDQIHEINAGDALVDAGVRWIDLLQATVPAGKSPPTLTDYIGLTVGGTLSVGGIGGQTFRAGLQVDNVIELEVVTGTGQRVTCSATHKSDLFDAARAGLGQFGVITKARVRLVPVPSMARTYTASYADLTTFTNDQRAAIASGRWDYVEGSASPGGTGWTFQIELVKYFDPASPPDDAAQLAGLSYLPGTAATGDGTYFDFTNRIAPTIALLQEIGLWEVPHPWIDFFVPASEAVEYIQGFLDTTSPGDIVGPVLIYPFYTARVATPFVRLPASSEAFLFAVLRFALPPTPDQVAALIAQNRAAFDALTAVGGKRYLIDSVPMSHADWEEHFAPVFDAFVDAKERFDPHHVMTPGQGIF